jgi:hypothetical protein
MINPLIKIPLFLELIKCSNDPIYFINNYVKFSSFKEDNAPFLLYPAQEEIVKKIHKNKYNLIKAPRQFGKSSVPLFYLLHQAIFKSNCNIVISSFSYQNSKYLLERFYNTYEQLPDWIKPGIVKRTSMWIILKNNSRVKIVTNISAPETWENWEYTHAFLDEFAFMEYYTSENLLGSFFHRNSSPKIIIASTKKEGSYFNEIVEDARNGINKYSLSEYDWRDIPRLDINWKEETIKNIREDAFKREFEL